MLDIYQCNSERVRAFPASAVVYYTMALSLYSEAAYEDVLAALYHERWEVELVFDELKTHLVQRRRVFRSKTPELVRQEFYGWMMAHYAVRWLMYQAAHGQAQKFSIQVPSTTSLRFSENRLHAENQTPDFI